MTQAFFRAVVLCGLLAAVGPNQPVVGQVPSKQKVVVHLSHYTDNLHAAKMALGLASRMQAMGAEVTLLLDLEGVRLASRKDPQDLVWGMGEPIGKTYETFVKLGGKVLLCPHCAHHAGIAPGDLRAGARIGKEDELASVILAAAKVLDY